MSKMKNQKAWEIFRRFPIGTQVKVTHELRNVASDKDRRRWGSEAVEPYTAWIVGASWSCDGKVETVHFPKTSFSDAGKETYLNVVSKKPVFLVKTSMMGLPIKVPIDGINVDTGLFQLSPVMATGTALSESARKILSEEAKQKKRDSKGRFVSAKNVKNKQRITKDNGETRKAAN